MMAATIKYEPVGFKRATLRTTNQAEIEAIRSLEAFQIILNRWHFRADDCREAADFFLKLAEELERHPAS